jgi:hypothetical protein
LEVFASFSSPALVEVFVAEVEKLRRGTQKNCYLGPFICDGQGEACRVG